MDLVSRDWLLVGLFEGGCKGGGGVGAGIKVRPFGFWRAMARLLEGIIAGVGGLRHRGWRALTWVLEGIGVVVGVVRGCWRVLAGVSAV